MLRSERSPRNCPDSHKPRRRRGERIVGASTHTRGIRVTRAFTDAGNFTNTIATSPGNSNNYFILPSSRFSNEAARRRGGEAARGTQAISFPHILNILPRKKQETRPRGRRLSFLAAFSRELSAPPGIPPRPHTSAEQYAD